MTIADTESPESLGRPCPRQTSSEAWFAPDRSTQKSSQSRLAMSPCPQVVRMNPVRNSTARIMFETAGSCTVQTCSMFKQFRLMSINAKIMQRLRFAALPFRDCFRDLRRANLKHAQQIGRHAQASIVKRPSQQN